MTENKNNKREMVETDFATEIQSGSEGYVISTSQGAEGLIFVLADALGLFIHEHPELHKYLEGKKMLPEEMLADNVPKVSYFSHTYRLLCDAIYVNIPYEEPSECNIKFSGSIVTDTILYDVNQNSNISLDLSYPDKESVFEDIMTAITHMYLYMSQHQILEYVNQKENEKVDGFSLDEEVSEAFMVFDSYIETLRSESESAMLLFYLSILDFFKDDVTLTKLDEELLKHIEIERE